MVEAPEVAHSCTEEAQYRCSVAHKADSLPAPLETEASASRTGKDDECDARESQRQMID
jgi:hypothetical protein